MQIGEIAAQAGVSAQTVRFYERRGLLKKPVRTRSGYRNYSASAVQIVRFIKQSQELGYTLEEIKQLLALREHKDRNAAARAMAAKIASINERIRGLEQMRGELEIVVAECQCGNETQPRYPIIEKLNHKAANFENLD